jgi:DNA recombination protein RmuC
MELSVLVLAVLVLGIALVLILKRPKSVDGISLDELNRLKGENERLKINEAKAVERAEGLGLERERLELKLNEINEELSVEKGRIAKAEEAFKAQRDRLNEQQEYIDKLQQQFKTEFENIANKLLEEKSNKFTEQNHKQLDIILSPFKEKLKDFEGIVTTLFFEL